MTDSRSLAVLFGAALVIGALFAPWYAVDLGPAAREALSSQANQLPGTFANFARQLVTLLPERLEASAWMAFERTDVVLLATAIAAAFAAMLNRFEIAATAGAVALANTIWVMVQRPGPSEYLSLQWGAWLALTGALLIVAASKLGGKTAAAAYVPPLDYAPAPVTPAAVLGDPARSVGPPRI
ncbi:MAG TPA: hypothetical protein VF526_10215 [Solirubrobacteraceae bacterium]